MTNTPLSPCYKSPSIRIKDTRYECSKCTKEFTSAVHLRGFASLSPSERRAVASKGGKAAHAYGNAHEFTAAEARKAGRIEGARGRRVTN